MHAEREILAYIDSALPKQDNDIPPLPKEIQTQILTHLSPQKLNTLRNKILDDRLKALGAVMQQAKTLVNQTKLTAAEASAAVPAPGGSRLGFPLFNRVNDSNSREEEEKSQENLQLTAKIYNPFGKK